MDDGLLTFNKDSPLSTVHSPQKETQWHLSLKVYGFGICLVIANRSALEVVGCLYLAKRRSYISDEKFSELYSKIDVSKNDTGINQYFKRLSCGLATMDR